MTDDEVLRHFDFKPEFEERSRHWESDLRQLFCRLVCAIQLTGLDLYHINRSNEIRFGRKNPEHKLSHSVAGLITLTSNGIRISSSGKWLGKEIKSIKVDEFSYLNSRLVGDIEQELRDWTGIPEKLRKERAGLWPDQYLDHESNVDQKRKSDSAETSPANSRNKILYGPPGTGKTYATFRRCVEICDGAAPADEEELCDRYHELVEKGRVEFVTFHQSYGYEEFVEGLRPQTGSTEADSGSAGFRLDPEDGVLKRIAERARKDPAPAANPQPYVLVIDEINRGNISKVFGEAITLLETDKRSGARHRIPVTLPYSGKRFTLPANLYVLGTMNTADRSIALLDTALRRRFEFEELAPKPELLADAAEKSGIKLPAVLAAMNERLEWLLGRDHLLGHAWLMDVEGKDDVDRKMRQKIIPMLAEYFHEDWGRVRAVLGGGDGFIESKKLDVPPELDDMDISEDRYRWTVRDVFSKAAYDRLIFGQAKQMEVNDDGTEDDSD